MRLLENLKKNKEVKTYITKLPKILSKDYGKSEYYTPAQVKNSLERAGLMGVYAYYAMVLYCDRTDLKNYALQVSEPFDYEEVKTDIADTYFDGNTEFTPKMIDALSDSYNSSVPFDNFDVEGEIDINSKENGVIQSLLNNARNVRK